MNLDDNGVYGCWGIVVLVASLCIGGALLHYKGNTQAETAPTVLSEPRTTKIQMQATINALKIQDEIIAFVCEDGMDFARCSVHFNGGWVDTFECVQGQKYCVLE